MGFSGASITRVPQVRALNTPNPTSVNATLAVLSQVRILTSRPVVRRVWFTTAAEAASEGARVAVAKSDRPDNRDPGLKPSRVS